MTILFADLVGFTPYAEDRDAEEVRETLSRYFDLASAVVARFGGTIEKFIGDAVMAVWGTPIAREDDAERAVRAALDLVDAVGALGSDIQARAGVLTGEAAVTLGATNQGMVAGDLVNTASRLQSVAPTGSVLVGDTTYRAASRAITFEPVGEVELKGKTAPVPAWRAVRVMADLGGRGARETLEAPFVGRDGELRLVKELFHATERERRVRLVSVLGVGGIGKSRLIREFEKYLDGLVGDVWWHQGRSPAYDQGITFWALADMVRGRARLNDTADEAATRRAIAALVDRVMGDDPLRGWVEQALLELLGVRVGIAPDELFGAWRTFFERLGADGPVVLIFQDLHWADQGTLQFIDHLLEWSRGTALFVITLARPELLDRRPDWGAGQRSFSSVHLEPLPEPAMRELLHGLVPGLPESAVAAIAQRAEGVPLYAIETVRMLLASGSLVTDDDGIVRPVGDLTALAVPETLTALIAARLDALEPADRALLLDAAVLGQSFTPSGLAAISGSEVADIEPRLRSLVRREVLTAVTDPLSPERGQYQFVQALIREVAYNTLARRDRKVRHLAAARWFESLGEEELAGALAGHYLSARENATDRDEADALAAQARIALRAAAERAAALGSSEQAIRFAEQAIVVTTDPADLADLETLAASACMTLSRYDDGERFYLAAMALLEASGDEAGHVLASARLIRDLLTGRRLDRAGELIAATEPIAAALPDRHPARLLLDAQRARLAFFLLDHEACIAISDRVLTIAERDAELAILADVLVTKGTLLHSLARRREGAALLDAGRQVAEEAGLSAIVLRALNNRMSVSTDVDPAAAVVTAREGMTLAQRLGQGYWVQSMVGNMAYAALRTGDWTEAIDLAMEVLRRVDDPNDRTVLVNNLANLRLLRGDPEAAELLAELEATVAGAAAEDVVVRTFLEESLGWQAFVAGDLDGARRHWSAVVSLDPSTAGMSASWTGRIEAWQAEPDAAEVRILQHHDASGRGGSADGVEAVLAGSIAAARGDHGLAVQRWREAARLFDAMHLPVDEAFIAFDALHLLGPDDPYTREILPGARATFARLGARPIVEQLDALAGAPADPVRAAELADPLAAREMAAG